MSNHSDKKEKQRLSPLDALDRFFDAHEQEVIKELCPAGYEHCATLQDDEVSMDFDDYHLVVSGDFVFVYKRLPQ